MLEKGFLKNQKKEKTRNSSLVSMVSNTLLYVGLIVLVATFAYLLFNLDKSDSLIGILMPFLFAGLGLVFVSQLIKRGYSKLRR